MNFFFVSGAHKSGTSWLAGMLREHPEIAMPSHEMWLFGHPNSLVGDNLRKAVDKWLALPTVAEEFPPQNRVYSRVARGVVTAILRKYSTPETRALGDKSPLFSLRGSKDIQDLFPDAHLIVIYRDGRDVAVSYHFHNLRLRDFRKYENKAGGEAAYQHHIQGAEKVVPLLHRATLEEACRDWVQCNSYAETARIEFGERFLMTSYEALFSDPVPFLTRVYSALGVRADPELVERIAGAKAFASVTKGRRPGVMDPKSFFRIGEPGDWQNYFDAESAVWFNQIAGDWLLKLGYADALDWWNKAPAANSVP